MFPWARYLSCIDQLQACPYIGQKKKKRKWNTWTCPLLPSVGWFGASSLFWNASLVRVTMANENVNLIYYFDHPPSPLLHFKPIQHVWSSEFHIVSLLCDTLTACKSERADCLVSDACTDDPCLNGGTCTERNGHVHCLCLPTYAGDFCQTGELFSVGATCLTLFQETE